MSLSAPRGACYVQPFRHGVEDGPARVIDWLRRNLFSSVTNTLLTLLVLSLALAYVTWRFLKANKKANARLKQVNQLLWERSNARANQIVKLAHYNAHEVRGPLARIQGLVNVMRSEGVRTPELSGNLEMLETSAHDLDQVIQRMNEIIHKGPPAVERLTTAENP